MKKFFSTVIAVVAAMAMNATDYYIVGSGSQGWSQDKEANKFVDVDGVLTVTVDQLYGELKVTENGGWHPQWGKTVGADSLVLGTPYTLTKCDDTEKESDAANLPIALPQGWRYKDAVLTLDATNPEAIGLTLESGELYDPAAAPTAYYLIGGCTNNWDLASAVEFTAVEGVLTANIEDLNGTFKIIKNREWGWEAAAPAGTKINGNDPFTLSVGGDNIGFANPFAGYHNAVMTLDMTNAEAPVITLVSGEFYVFQADWYLPGAALGWSCGDDQKFTPVKGKENTYEINAAHLGGDLKPVYGNWAVEFSVAATDSVTRWAPGVTLTNLVTPAPKDWNIKCAAEGGYDDVTVTLVVDYVNATIALSFEAEGQAIENSKLNGKAAKAIVGKDLVIIKNGVRYNVLGARL